MKTKFYLTLILIGFGYILFGQKKQQLDRSIFVKYGSDTTITVYKYASTNRSVTPMVKETYEPNIFLNNRQNALLYHNADTVYTSTNDGTESKQINKYNSDNRIIEMVYSNSFDTIITTELRYHDNGFLAYEKERTTHLPSELITEMITYFYDDGRTMKSEFSEKQANYRNIKYTVNYLYNNYLQLVEKAVLVDTMIINTPFLVYNYLYFYHNNKTKNYTNLVAKGVYYERGSMDVKDSLLVHNRQFDEHERIIYDSAFYYLNFGSNQFKNYTYVNDTVFSETELWDYSNSRVSSKWKSKIVYTQNKQPILRQYWEFKSNSIIDFTEYINYYNALNQLDSVMKIDNQKRELVYLQNAYNTADNLVSYINLIENIAAYFYYKDLPNNPDEEPFGLNIYPNPVVKDVQIVVNLQDYDVIIYNSTGKIVGHFHNVQKIDCSNLSSGVYYIRVLDKLNQASRVVKIVK